MTRATWSSIIRRIEMLALTLFVFAALAIHNLIGCIIGAICDDENDSIFNWVARCPLGFVVGVMLWPLWARDAYAFFRKW
jgi:hypothetical protein